VFLVEATGCLGYPNALPPPLAGSESTGGETTTGMVEETTTGTSTGESSSSTGPIAECGNGVVEEGEDCDGTDFGVATCESLGLSETGLMCVGCQFDVSGCGPAPGMVLIPGGTFEMGSDYSSNQWPIRQVQVDSFWMDETEVTVGAYSGCVDDGACSQPSTGGSCNWMVAGRENHPVNCVTWSQAEAFCGWAGGGTKRLPTEAEWEKAARGTDAREYPWGDSPVPTCSHVVMNDAAAGGSGCGLSSTRPVGSKPLGDSPYGAHDMAGNVREWVADWYASSYDAAETDNPTGPALGTSRVLRGGSWFSSNTNHFRAAYRGNNNPAHGNNYVGFRCARTPPAPL
jgi:formylglycine-generating enzyme